MRKKFFLWKSCCSGRGNPPGHIPESLLQVTLPWAGRSAEVPSSPSCCGSVLQGCVIQLCIQLCIQLWWHLSLHGHSTWQQPGWGWAMDQQRHFCGHSLHLEGGISGPGDGYQKMRQKMDLLGLLRSTTVLSHTGSFPLLVVTECEVLLPLLLILRVSFTTSRCFFMKEELRRSGTWSWTWGRLVTLRCRLSLLDCVFASYLSASPHTDQRSTSDVFLVAFLITFRVCSVRAVRT